MARLRLFASAREAVGATCVELEGVTVGQVLEAAVAKFGSRFERILQTSSVWLNGEEASPDTRVGADDEVVVLPPVSGG